MRLLVDNQLPVALCRHLRAQGVECQHVADWGLDAASDLVIWREAGRQGYAIVTKDEDFLHLADLQSDGPSLVWVRLGNCRKKTLLAVFDAVLPRLLDALDAGQRIIEVRG